MSTRVRAVEYFHVTVKARREVHSQTREMEWN